MTLDTALDSGDLLAVAAELTRVNICATFRKPDLLGYWAECSCDACVWMRGQLGSRPLLQYDKPLGPEKGQSRQEYIEHTVGRLERQP